MVRVARHAARRIARTCTLLVILLHAAVDKFEVRYLLKDSLKLQHMTDIPLEEVEALFVKFDKDNSNTIVSAANSPFL